MFGEQVKYAPGDIIKANDNELILWITSTHHNIGYCLFSRPEERTWSIFGSPVAGRVTPFCHDIMMSSKLAQIFQKMRKKMQKNG